MKAVAEPMDVKQRKSKEETVVGANSPARRQIGGIRGEVVVG
jgi:hypothetical protein